MELAGRLLRAARFIWCVSIFLYSSDYIYPAFAHPIDRLVKTDPRVAALREQMIGLIPFEPNDRNAIDCLRAMSMDDLLGVYLNWADQLIPPRPRKVAVWDGFWARNDPTRFAAELNRIIADVRQGADLSPYLSSKIDSYRYRQKPSDRRGIDWFGKDSALNNYDVHHLHFVPKNANGNRKRDSDSLLFAGVSRETFLLLMIGDHSSFDSYTLREAVAAYRVQAGCVLKGVVGTTPDYASNGHQPSIYHGIVSPMAVRVGTH